MIVLYATMMADEKMLINDKRLNIKLDNHYLENKIIVMDEEYYLEHGYEYENIRIIIVGKNNLSKELDIEYHENIYKLANSKYFKDKELYIVGSSELLKQAIPLSDKMELNIVDMYLEENDKTAMPFPKYDYQNWKYTKSDMITPRITKVILDRVNPYGYNEKTKKRVKK